MDMSQLMPYFVVANFLQTWAVAFYAHLIGKNKPVTDRMEQLEAQMGAQEKLLQQQIAQLMERITRLEVLLEKSPSHKDFDKVYDRLNEQSREVAEMAGELRQMNANLRMVVSHLNGSHKASAPA